MTELEVNLFGSMQVWRKGTPVTQFKTRTERALLAYLLLHAGRPLSRLRAATLLWPESNDSAALKNLRVVLARLRKTLDEKASPSPFIMADRTQLCFNTSGMVRLDVAEFRHAIQRLQALSAAAQLSNPEAVTMAQQALSCYTDELMTGFDSGSELFDEWLLSERSELHRMAIWVGSLAVQQVEQLGDYAAMSQWARQLIEWDPWYEEAHHWLMHALQAQGQRQSALLHYEQLRTQLAEELGSAPGRQLQAFYTWLAMDGANDASTPPVQNKTPPRPGNLPAMLVPCLGRERELAWLSQQIMGATHRLITLTGLGGVGKTRLALAAAHHLASGFVDGAWFVEVVESGPGAMPDADRIAHAIVAALQLYINAQQPITEQVIEHLHDRHCLIVLDNLDDLLDGVAFLLSLLRRAPNVSLLVTAREPFDCLAETVFAVDGLSLPPAHAAAAMWQKYPASHLFVEHIQRSIPAFCVDSENWPQIQQLCQQVGGMPLALELAASALRTLTLAELIDRLAQSLQVLTTRRRDLPPKHRTMYAAIEASWRVLSATEQQIVAHLSVFRQSFAVDAAHVVTKTDTANVETLVVRSFVQRLPTGRLQLHPLLRQYAAERLAQAPAPEEMAHRHARYYLAQLRAAQSGLFGPNPRGAVQQLLPEVSNVQQAWRWVAQSGDVAPLVDTFPALIRLHQLSGSMQAIVDLLCESQNALEQRSITSTRQHLLLYIWIERAKFYEFSGDIQKATNLVEIAFAQLRHLPHAGHTARAHLTMGDIRQADGYPVEARSDFETALAAAQESGDLRLQATCLSRLTYFLTQTTQHSERALQLARHLQDGWLEGRALNMLGISQANAGRYEQSYRCFAELLVLNERLSVEHLRKGSLYSNLGRIMNMLGDYERGLAHYERSLEYAQLFRNQSEQAFALLGISHSSQQLGDIERALTTAETASHLLRHRGGRADRVFVYLALGRAWLSAASHANAQAAFAEALEIAEGIKLKMFAPLCRAGLIDVQMSTGSPHAATAHAELIWHDLQDNPLNPTLEPFYIYWNTARVFHATADPRTDELLHQAHSALQKRADTIEDSHLRHLFLNRIDVNRDLVQLWQTRNNRSSQQFIPQQFISQPIHNPSNLHTSLSIGPD